MLGRDSIPIPASEAAEAHPFEATFGPRRPPTGQD